MSRESGGKHLRGVVTRTVKNKLHLTGALAAAWSSYEPAVDALTGANLPFALTGGQALACYTGRMRPSKDLDFAILPEDRETAIGIVRSCGFDDYYDRHPYDRHWIFRSCRHDTILDLIWAMPNRRAYVDSDWILNGPVVRLRGKQIRVVAPEELLWAKLYVLQRDRCDWPDVLNLVHAMAGRLNWRHLLDRLGQDAALLSSLLIVFCWLRPDSARRLPSWLWRELHLPIPSAWEIPDVNRESLLDTRDWFHHPGEALKEAV